MDAIRLYKDQGIKILAKTEAKIVNEKYALNEPSGTATLNIVIHQFQSMHSSSEECKIFADELLGNLDDKYKKFARMKLFFQ